MRTTTMTLGLLAALALAAGCEKNESGGADEPGPPPPGDAEASEGAGEGAGGSGDMVGDARRQGEQMVEEASDEAKAQAEQAVEEAREQVAEVTEESRATMRGYLDTLEDLTGKLSELKAGGIGQLGNLASSPEIKSLVDQVKGYASELAGLDSNVLDKLKGQFGDRLSSVTGAFRAQVDRIGEIEQLSTVKEMLDGIDLI